MAKHCVVYLRVSTAEQAAPGHHSLGAQEQLCRRYAADQGFSVADVLRDEGYSGRTTKRPGLRRLYEYTSARPPTPITAILVQDTSRLGRDTTEYLLFRRELRERGIDLIAVTQPNIDSSPEGRLIDTIMAGINQYQSEEKGRRVAIALQKKFEDGWWPGWAPLGYVPVEDEGRRTVGADPDRFALLELAFREYATGRYAQHQLSQYLAARGLTNRLRRPITRTTVNDVLANPFYWGLMRWQGQERLGRHEPAIDRATWEKCQAITAEHNKYAARVRKHEFLLAGLSTCAVCGGPHTHTVNARRGKRYYHCTSRAQCPQPYIPEEALDNQVARLISEIRFPRAVVGEVLKKARELFARRRRAQEREQAGLRRRKEMINQQRAMAEEKLLSGVLADEAYRRQVVRLDRECAAVEQQLATLEDDGGKDALREILSFARDIPGTYGAATVLLKRRYIRFFFDRLVVRDRQLVKAVPTPFFRALQRGRHETTALWALARHQHARIRETSSSSLNAGAPRNPGPHLHTAQQARTVW